MGLPQSIEAALNKQIAYEAYASHFYLALAYWCDDQALDGCKRYFLRQSEEERMHMLKIYDYLSEKGSFPETSLIEQPQIKYESIVEAFDKVYEQEHFVTISINDIVNLCYSEKDFATLQFLQWFVEEQREEEASIRAIIDRIKVIGSGGQSLYYIDKEVDKINAQALLEDTEE
jgi:ferritin